MLGIRWGHLHPVERMAPKAGFEDMKGALVSGAFPVPVVATIIQRIIKMDTPRGTLDDIWTKWRDLDQEARRSATRSWTQTHGGPAVPAPAPPAEAATDGKLGPEGELAQ